MKLDILAFGAHPDDVEISCAGTLIKEVQNEKKVGVIDLTQGELGSRGTKETRKEEAKRAAEILQLSIRENLMLADGFFEVNEENLLKIISKIRQYKPNIIITNSKTDRHPDHGRGYELVERAAFLAGLVKIETSLKGEKQEKWRPNLVLNYIQDHYIKPDVVVDITNTFETKMKSILAYKTQFYNPDSTEPQTPISSPEFLEHIKGRALQFGRNIKVKYAEGFTCSRILGVDSVFDLL